MFIPFGEYRPDAAALSQDATALAQNVLPGPDKDYIPLPSLIEYSSALPERSRGVVGVRGTGGDVQMYVGDATKLQQLSGRNWTDKSRSGGYTMTGGEQWEFAQYRDRIIAASWENPLQSSTIGGGNFSNLLTSSRKPQARHIGVVRNDWVVLGNCTDGVDGDQETRVWWLKRGDPTSADPSITNQCGFEDLDSEDGSVQRIVGGEFGTILCQKAIYRMTYEGGDVQYRFDKVALNRGTISGGSVAVIGRMVFFLDDDGPYVFNGVEAVPIGEGKVAKTIFADFEKASGDWISSTVFPAQSVVVWAIPVGGDLVQRLYFYNWKTGRWSSATVDCEMVFSAATSGLFIDGEELGDLLIDQLPQADWITDSAEFVGGVVAPGVFNPAHKACFFSGPAMEATVETAEVQPMRGRRLSVTGIRPIVEDTAGTVMVQAVTRETLSEQPAVRSEAGVNLVGVAPVLAQGRYLRSRVRITGGFSHALGVDVDYVQLGVR